MSHTFSTLNNQVTGGRVFSSRQSQVTVLPVGAQTPAAGGIPTRPAVRSVSMPALATPAPMQFELGSPGLKAAPLLGPAAIGTVTLRRNNDGTFMLSAQASGLNPIRDPAILPTLWLIHDLTVPHDLAPQDLAALPKGPSGTGNSIGSVFTLDGNPPTYGERSNTLSVCISPGTFTPQPNGSWTLASEIGARTNVAFHPMVLLGPQAMADINAALPSGTVARILADMCMRPATVHPQLSPRTHFQQRLAAVVRDVLAIGTVEFLDGAAFGRAAVTLEGPVRTTSNLMPTPQACCLMSTRSGL